MRPGIFISFEGIDGAGKSTHIEALADALRAEGHEVIVTREPGGTPLAEKLRALVLHDAMDPLTESLLVFAARRDHLGQVIVPALRAGHTVICDRFTDATFAYQGGGRSFDLDVLTDLEALVQDSADLGFDAARPSLVEPDLTLWFDLDPDVAAQRLASARVPDRFEAEPAEFFRRVGQGYARRAAAAPGRFARIDAAAERALVWHQVAQAVRTRGWIA